jgi:hypothetical protein
MEGNQLFRAAPPTSINCPSLRFTAEALKPEIRNTTHAVTDSYRAPVQWVSGAATQAMTQCE